MPAIHDLYETKNYCIHFEPHDFLPRWFMHGFVINYPRIGLRCEFTDAARRGDVLELERLYRKGAQINSEPSAEDGAVAGYPALAAAVLHGRVAAVEWLLSRNADANQWTVDSKPLALAEEQEANASRIVACLKAHGATGNSARSH